MPLIVISSFLAICCGDKKNGIFDTATLHKYYKMNAQQKTKINIFQLIPFSMDRMTLSRDKQKKNRKFILFLCRPEYMLQEDEKHVCVACSCVFVAHLPANRMHIAVECAVCRSKIRRAPRTHICVSGRRQHVVMWCERI